jgi:hypothetical protein
MNGEGVGSASLVASLRELRADCEYRRAELYWTVQRLGRSWRRAAAINTRLQRTQQFDLCGRPKPPALRLYRFPPHVA